MSMIFTKSNNIPKKALSSGIFACLVLWMVVSVNVTQANDITADNVVRLVNDARKDADTKPLTESPMLQSAAEAKTKDMISNDYFAHISPTGKTPWDFITQAGYDYRFAGENLAINFTDAKDQQAAWMASPLHRENILNSDYQEIGVAVGHGVINGHDTTVTVQEFGTQMAFALQQATANSKTSSNIAAIAGVAANKEEIPNQIAAPQSVSKPAPTIEISSLSQSVYSQIMTGEIFKNNRLTLAGWVGVFVFAITLTAFDVVALIYKKHKQVLILHDWDNNQL